MKTNTRLIFCVLCLAFLPATIPLSVLTAQQYVKSDFMVSDETAYSYQAPQLSVNTSSDMAIVWETSGVGDIWLKIVSSKGEVLSNQISVDAPFSTFVTRVAQNDIDNIMVIFGALLNSWSVMGQTYTATGDPLGDTLEVDRNTTEQIHIDRSSLGSNSTGQFGAFLPGLDSMIVEMLSESGEFLSNTIVLKPDAQSFSELYGLMTYKGDLILLWLDNSDGNIWGRIFSGDGVAKGAAFQISNKDVNSYVSGALISSDTAGNFAVVWKNTLDTHVDIYSQVLSNTGVPVGVNKKVTDDQAKYLGYKKSISMDGDGNFVVAWGDYRNSDTAFIYLQQMDKLGEPVGHNYRATTINNGGPAQYSYLPSQVQPDVRLLRDTIYLTWVNLNENVSNNQNIFASILEWRIPDYTGLKQTEAFEDAFTLYPNPSDGKFTLQSNADLSGSVEISVYNSAGVRVHRETLQVTGEAFEMDLKDIQEGVYFMNIDGELIHSSIPLVIKR